MRQRELRVIFTFHTTAAAMSMEALCKRNGLPGRLIPVPRSISADCGMAWSAPVGMRERLEHAPGVPTFAGIYERLI